MALYKFRIIIIIIIMPQNGFFLRFQCTEFNFGKPTGESYSVPQSI